MSYIRILTTYGKSTRRSIAALALLTVIVLGAAGGSAQPQARPALARHVIVVSFDGLRADALRSVWTPALQNMAAASWSARTTVPSSTLPAHTSMVTGVGPEIHRVKYNDWRHDRPRLARETIFTRVRRHGGTVRVVVAKPKLRFLTPPDLPVEYLRYPYYRAADVIALAAKHFAEKRPTLLFVHVADPDDAGHTRGWMSPKYLEVVSQIPGLVTGFTQVISAVDAWENTLLIVTADHGGHDYTHGSVLREDVTIPWIALGGPVRAGTTVQRTIMTYDTAATVLFALGISIPQAWQGRPVDEALKVPAAQRR